MDSYMLIEGLQLNTSLRGPTSCIMWATRPDDLQESLCFGTMAGYMVFWQQGPRESGFKDFLAKILSWGGDTKVRFAVGTRDKIVQVWNYDPKGVLHPVFSVELGITVPRHLGFADNITQDIYVFGLFNGQMRSFSLVRDRQTLRGNYGKIISIHEVSQRMRTGATLDVLHHADEGLVQTLMVPFPSNCNICQSNTHSLQIHDNAGKSMIITASSGFCHKSSICLWAHVQHKEKPVRSLKRHWTLGSVIKYIWYMFINLTILLAAGAVVYQNLNVGSIKSIYMAMGRQMWDSLQYKLHISHINHPSPVTQAPSDFTAQANEELSPEQEEDMCCEGAQHLLTLVLSDPQPDAKDQPPHHWTSLDDYQESRGVNNHLPNVSTNLPMDDIIVGVHRLFIQRILNTQAACPVTLRRPMTLIAPLTPVWVLSLPWTIPSTVFGQTRM
ncbi:hypothetical protein BU17DRAFT_68559 [Hysterangium stoloniferum]|nr:hypothetical protein BU17DRAFT_68559 [Hysterangium stoloniferum]